MPQHCGRAGGCAHVSTYVRVRERHNFRCTYHMRMRIQFRRLPCLWLEKMSETRCRDDTVPKNCRYKKALQGRVESMQQSSATPSPHLCFSGFRKIVACSQPYLAVLSCIYKYKNQKYIGCRDDTVPKTGDSRRHCEVELTVCNNLPQHPSLHLAFWGLRKIVAYC